MVTPQIELSTEHIEAVNRRRRTVLNYDSLCCLPPFASGDVEPEQLVEYSLSFIDTGLHGIDSVWWNFDEGNEVPYPSKILPAFRLAKFQDWVRRGVDIVRLYVDETRKRGLETFVSWRMNGSDNYWSNKFLNDLPVAGPLGRDDPVPLKKAHPQWLMEVWDGNMLWNYAEEGVHEYRRRCFRELAENYDLDGIDMDFCRSVPVLPLNRQWELRDRLTQFVRSVRLMLLDIERERGRPLLLAARVPDHVDGAKRDGFDLERWAREHLVDIFVPGARSLDNDVPGFRRITAGRPIKVYPCIDGHHSSDGYGHPSIEVLRGLHSTWTSQGADGVLTFNFCNMTWEGCAKIDPRHLMQGEGPVRADVPGLETQNRFYGELADPEQLRYRDKSFVVQRRGGGSSAGSEMWPAPEQWIKPKYGYACTNMFAPLPAGIDNGGHGDTVLTLVVGDDIGGADDRVRSATLRVLLSDPAAVDLPAVARLLPAEIRAPWTKMGPCNNVPPAIATVLQLQVRFNRVVLGRASVRRGWLVYRLDPQHVLQGTNTIGLRVHGRRVNVEKLELHVNYRAEHVQ